MQPHTTNEPTQTIRRRVSKKVPMQTITMRLPSDLVEDLKRVAPTLGYAGYQQLIRAYVGKCLREDLANLGNSPLAGMVENLRKAGVAEEVIAEAVANAQG